MKLSTAKMLSTAKVLFVPLTLAMLPGVVCAKENLEQEQKQQLKAEAEFKKLDTNQDGMVDQRELQKSKNMIQEFAEVDVDRDGIISVGEYILYKGEATAAGTMTRPLGKELETEEAE